MDDSTPTALVRSYYQVLRNGDPLSPFFADDETVVKVGISERLVGADAVREGLTEQTRTTADWTVRSEDLRVAEGDGFARFDDEVLMAWRDTEADADREFRTRWSGTLADRDGWVVLGMHVSAPQDL